MEFLLFLSKCYPELSEDLTSSKPDSVKFRIIKVCFHIESSLRLCSVFSSVLISPVLSEQIQTKWVARNSGENAFSQNSRCSESKPSPSRARLPCRLVEGPSWPSLFLALQMPHSSFCLLPLFTSLPLPHSLFLSAFLRQSLTLWPRLVSLPPRCWGLRHESPS